MDRGLEQLVWQRADGRCEYCGMAQQFDDTTFQIDHIIAESHAGPTELDNLCWDTSIKLPAQEREMMLDMWHLGHDLAKGVGYRPDSSDFIRNDVGGTVWVLRRGSR